jgi:hypothetical protein
VGLTQAIAFTWIAGEPSRTIWRGDGGVDVLPLASLNGLARLGCRIVNVGRRIAGSA